jgi:threonine/homoserine/homoserine lactone efflux protein
MENVQAYFTSMAAFGVSYALVVMLPGPNMALVAKAGLTMSPASRSRTVAGIVLGATALVLIATLATGTLSSDPNSNRLLALGAGGVLIGLGLRMMWRRRARLPTTPDADSGDMPCGLGAAFMTAFANPTTAAYFASSSLSVSALAPSTRLVTMAITVSAVATAWFGFMTWALSRECLRFRATRFMREIETGAALMLIAFGIMTMLRVGN